MTDRDTFAAAALTGLIANGDYSVDATPLLAYRMADAMLRERSRTGQSAEDTPPQSRAGTPTLTDEEREAVEIAAAELDDEYYGTNCKKELAAAASLRNLLERMA